LTETGANELMGIWFARAEHCRALSGQGKIAFRAGGACFQATRARPGLLSLCWHFPALFWRLNGNRAEVLPLTADAHASPAAPTAPKKRLADRALLDSILSHRFFK